MKPILQGIRRHKLVSALFGFGLVALTLSQSNLLVNVSDSLPPGLWYISKQPVILEHGRIVTFCPTLSEYVKANYHLGNQNLRWLRRCSDPVDSFTKPVAALPGDTVQLTTDAIYVNGQKLAGRIHRDAYGHAIPSVGLGTYVVAPGTFWAVSTYNQASYDSRYLGAIPISAVLGETRPLWVSKAKKFCWITGKVQHSKQQCLT